MLTSERCSAAKFSKKFYAQAVQATNRQSKQQSALLRFYSSFGHLCRCSYAMMFERICTRDQRVKDAEIFKELVAFPMSELAYVAFKSELF